MACGSVAGMAKVAGSDPVPLWRLFLRMGGWFALAFAVPLVILTLISNWQLGLAQRFETEGRESVATVRDKYFTESTDSDGDRTVTYYLVLDYITDAGKEMNINRAVGSGLYNRSNAGDTMPIWYLESAPDRTELRRGETLTGSRVAQWIGLVFGLLVLGFGWYSGRWAVAAVRARRYGVRETAAVTGTKRTAVKVNNKSRYRLTWREASGREGESLMYPYDELGGYPVGSEIAVYQGITRAWWTGDVGEHPGE